MRREADRLSQRDTKWAEGEDSSGEDKEEGEGDKINLLLIPEDQAAASASSSSSSAVGRSREKRCSDIGAGRTLLLQEGVKQRTIESGCEFATL